MIITKVMALHLHLDCVGVRVCNILDNHPPALEVKPFAGKFLSLISLEHAYYERPTQRPAVTYGWKAKSINKN